MSSNNVNPNVVNSIVGFGTTFSGDLDISGLLKVDGDFTGSIKSDGKVLIGHTGRAKCSIFAKNVVVGGVLKGDIYAEERVVVLSSGLVLGNIRSSQVVLEKGVLINGEVTVVKDTGESDKVNNDGVKREFSPFSVAN